jgi:hypothetical protein
VRSALKFTKKWLRVGRSSCLLPSLDHVQQNNARDPGRPLVHREFPIRGLVTDSELSGGAHRSFFISCSGPSAMTGTARGIFSRRTEFPTSIGVHGLQRVPQIGPRSHPAPAPTRLLLCLCVIQSWRVPSIASANSSTGSTQDTTILMSFSTTLLSLMNSKRACSIASPLTYILASDQSVDLLQENRSHSATCRVWCYSKGTLESTGMDR